MISALKAPINTGGCWPREWCHSLKLQRVTAVKIATVAVELSLTKSAILSTLEPTFVLHFNKELQDRILYKLDMLIDNYLGS